jgi:hypothetical protein
VVSSSLVHVARDSLATFRPPSPPPHQHEKEFSRWWQVENQHDFPKISLKKLLFNIPWNITLLPKPPPPTHFCDSPKKNIVKELEVATKLKKFILNIRSPPMLL